MKTIIFSSILFCAITLPALGALTDADLDKIRLIVNDAEKRIKAEVKADIAAVKKELKADIAAVKKDLKEEIAKSEERVKEYVVIKSNSVDDKITFLSYLVYALIALIVGAIAIPQFVVMWRSGRDRSLEKQVEILTQEIEKLKQQRIVNS